MAINFGPCLASGVLGTMWVLHSIDEHVYWSLNLFKGGYLEDYIGDSYRAYTRGYPELRLWLILGMPIDVGSLSGGRQKLEVDKSICNPLGYFG